MRSWRSTPVPENNLFNIKKRISAATQTRKITRTMELIASSRLQRGKLLLASCQEWLKHMREATQYLPDSYYELLPDTRNPGSSDKKIYIVFGGSKGLSGAYSPNLLSYAKPAVSGHIVIAIGNATEAFFPDARSLHGDEIPSADYARDIVQAAKTISEKENAHEAHLIYTRDSMHVTERLFPLIRREQETDDVIFEPSARVLFPALFDEYAESVVYEAHLQAFVSEQIARVSAMDSATQNADEIIEDLQASYNRIRQSSITQEIIAVSNVARGDR